MPIRSFRPADVPMDGSFDCTTDAPFLPGATCSIGRAKYHDIVLNSPHVGDDHAVVYNHAEHGLLVVDMYTEAGTFVGGERLPPLQPLPLRALSGLAIPVYGISTGEFEVIELVKRIAQVLRTKTDFPNQLSLLFVPSHPFAYDPAKPSTLASTMQWRPVPASTTSASKPEPEPCPPSEPSPAPPSPHTPPRTTRRFSPLPQRTTRVSGPLPPSSRVYRQAPPGRIYNHPSPRVSSPLTNLRGSPLRASPLATRASPAAVPRSSPFTPPTPDNANTNERRKSAYSELPRDSPFRHEAPRDVPLTRTQASTPNVPRTPHPQDADTMPTHSPFPRPILKTQAGKRAAADDDSSRPRKRARTTADEADRLVRGMPGAWPYESGSSPGSGSRLRREGLREESLKERVERERGGRRKVRFGEPGVWAGAQA